jgi:hypothetical protein
MARAKVEASCALLCTRVFAAADLDKDTRLSNSELLKWVSSSSSSRGDDDDAVAVEQFLSVVDSFLWLEQ